MCNFEHNHKLNTFRGKTVQGLNTFTGKSVYDLNMFRYKVFMAFWVTFICYIFLNIEIHMCVTKHAAYYHNDIHR